MPAFDKLLEAASIIAGSSKPSNGSKDLQKVLLDRLEQARKAAQDEEIGAGSLNTAEQDTALYSLSILEQVQQILDDDQSLQIFSLHVIRN